MLPARWRRWPRASSICVRPPARPASVRDGAEAPERRRFVCGARASSPASTSSD
ncbi:hypothetical protein BRADI_4g09815v3 [Brachypodium distachyon]|uniref:Uncharacterized protein n=1 Tax=Brachypodium distachyon TaxID=15368 RepID=A0A0Q3HFQ7_BRADI|nr:hypothetical protein BRADI_4g09815v3 [Brachypodium distachyon]